MDGIEPCGLSGGIKKGIFRKNIAFALTFVVPNIARQGKVSFAVLKTAYAQIAPFPFTSSCNDLSFDASRTSRCAVVERKRADDPTIARGDRA